MSGLHWTQEQIERLANGLDGEWEATRCKHGKLILGCEAPSCPEQEAYLEGVRKRHKEYIAEMDRALMQLLWELP